MNLSNENINVIVVGDLMIDTYFNSTVTRSAPEDTNIPVHNVLNQVYKLGGACNVALNIHNLGTNIELLGVVGDDVYGKQIEKILCDSNLKHKLFIDETRKTTQKNRIFSTFSLYHKHRYLQVGGIGKKSPPQKFQLRAKNPQPNFLWAANPFLCNVYQTYKQPTNHLCIVCRPHSHSFCNSTVFRQIPHILTL